MGGVRRQCGEKGAETECVCDVCMCVHACKSMYVETTNACVLCGQEQILTMGMFNYSTKKIPARM